ncbi:MAG: UDP-N-acetylmuramate dehydrogenase [Desulfobacteraceae bacterium]|nr:UDP-N-acetylmuramate dehydrogenase [Desulfobacteraceae bacterium]
MGENIQFDRAMSEYTTFRIGGKADAICFVQGLGELQQVFSYLNKEKIPYLLVGKGSNLLVRDGGFKGAVIIMRGQLATIKQHEKNDRMVMAGGGLTLRDLVRFCSQRGLGGLEFLSGIPGTVGGAVTMNAGAFGRAMGDVVQQVDLVTPEGEFTSKNRSDLTFSYRESSIQEGSLVVRASLQCSQETSEIVSGRVAEYLTRRKLAQPLDYPSAGSVFRNPSNDHAGRLIEQAGLKGKKIGGAMISPKHANYIVNTGGAQAEDILRLMEMAKEKVREATGVELEPEIKVVGD